MRLDDMDTSNGTNNKIKKIIVAGIVAIIVEKIVKKENYINKLSKNKVYEYN
jgi:hypothetical protein